MLPLSGGAKAAASRTHSKRFAPFHAPFARGGSWAGRISTESCKEPYCAGKKKRPDEMVRSLAKRYCTRYGLRRKKREVLVPMAVWGLTVVMSLQTVETIEVESVSAC